MKLRPFKSASLALGTIVVLTGSAAAASYTCTMTNECLLDEACSATDFTFEISDQDPKIFTDADGEIEIKAAFAKLISDAETIEGIIGQQPPSGGDFPQVFYGYPQKGTHMVSMSDTGAALYTMQLAQDAFSITYSGQCKVLN